MRPKLVAPRCSMLDTQPSPMRGHCRRKKSMVAVARVPTERVPSWTRTAPRHNSTAMPTPPRAVTAGHKAPVAQAERAEAWRNWSEMPSIRAAKVSSRPYPLTTPMPARASWVKLERSVRCPWMRA